MKMNKIIFLALFLLFPLFAHAQPDSCFLVLRFNGGYADIGSSNGVASLGALASNTRNWNVGLTIGFPVGEHFEAGFGFEFQKQRTVADSKMYLPKQWVAVQSTETNINLPIGKAYLAGSWRLFSRFYFNPVLSAGIGKATGTQEYLMATRKYIPLDVYAPIVDDISVVQGGESDISYNYFAIGLAPAFSFYLNRHIALNLETGCFRFSTTDWKWDNKQWLASVSPAYWQLGIIAAF